MNLVILTSFIISITVLQFRLTESKSLPDFPSGSSIVMIKDKLYIIGDDANSVLVTDKNYQETDRIPLFDYSEKRIPKEEKMDLEAAILLSEKKDRVMAFGSGSEEARQRNVLFWTRSNKKKRIISTDVFLDRVASHGIGEVNIEGATVIGKQVLLVNRGNITNPKNHLIITTTDFFQEPG